MKGEFIHGDFTFLNYEDNFFDIVIDRCSIVCVDKTAAQQTFNEIYRVLKKKGKFFFNSYSDDHTSCVTADLLENGITTNISQGVLVGNGDLSFYNKAELLNYFSSPWKLKEMKLKKYTNELDNYESLHSEWELIIEKMIKIRLVEKDDLEMLFQWRNIDKIISLSASQRGVSSEEHKYWFDQVFQSSKVEIYIIEKVKYQ